MAGATLSRPPRSGPGAPRGRRRAPAWPVLALGALAVVTAAGFVAYPTYPNYDSYASLVWARDVLHGSAPAFDAYRAPTQHPLAIAFAALLSLAGDGADRLLVGATLAAFVALVAGLYRLATVAFAPLVGAVAAVLLCTRFDFPFLALRAYVDIPYLALVVWAAALEAARPRRGGPVLALLVAAGLLRPEAWILSGVYLLWCAPATGWPRRLRQAALVAAAPLAWAAVDLAVTGDPLFSLTHTSGLAEELGRRQEASAIPGSTLTFLRGLDKTPVVAAGVLGIGLAATLFRRRARVPLALLVVGLATFALVGVSGLSVIFRYLLVPALMLMVFAAVAVAGWTLLPRARRARRAWALAAGLIVLYGIAFTVTHVTPRRFAAELRFRGDSHAALVALLRDPAVRAARRCGPVSLPNHKLVPEVRFVLDAGPADVVARSDRTQRARIRRGVAIYATERTAFLRYGFSPDPVRVALPLPGFERVATRRFFGAYARC
jgi:hypothetical protein